MERNKCYRSSYALEFNSVFGFHEKISVPYKENFYRTKAHHSNLYWGASLEAFKIPSGSKSDMNFFQLTAQVIMLILSRKIYIRKLTLN